MKKRVKHIEIAGLNHFRCLVCINECNVEDYDVNPEYAYIEIKREVFPFAYAVIRQCIKDKCTHRLRLYYSTTGEWMATINWY